MIAQIDAFATLRRGTAIWFEVRIYDHGEPRTRLDPGCDPNYDIGRVFVDIDRKDPEREEVKDLTDDEMEFLMVAAAAVVHEHIQESLMHY